MLTVTPRSGIFGESTNDEASTMHGGEGRLVQDVMTHEVATAEASITAKEAVEVLRNRNVPILVVCLEREPIIAITEYDLALNVIARGHADSISLYELIKKRTVIRCRENAILADAIDAILDHRLRHVPVVDTKDKLAGALSLVDAVGAITPDAAALRQTKIRQSWTVH